MPNGPCEHGTLPVAVQHPDAQSVSVVQVAAQSPPLTLTHAAPRQHESDEEHADPSAVQLPTAASGEATKAPLSVKHP